MRRPGRLTEKARTEKHHFLRQTAQLDGQSTLSVHENRPLGEFYKLTWGFKREGSLDFGGVKAIGDQGALLNQAP